MKNKRRSQVARSALTRDSLVAAARLLFTERGYSDVGTEEIVRAAGVTRGALYHHFADKTELFAAVFEGIEAEVIERIGATIAGAGQSDPIAAMRLGASTWLDACSEPEILRIALLEAPAVLGWTRWREIGSRYSMALVHTLLADAIKAGIVSQQPVEPLAYVILGAVRESAVYLAGAADRAQARVEVGAALDKVIRSLRNDPPKPTQKQA